jgi:surface antigen
MAIGIIRQRNRSVNSHERLSWRLFFLFICLLAATNLVVLSASLDADKVYPGLGTSLHKSMALVSHTTGAGLHAVATVPGHVTNFAASITDVGSFVKPSEDDKLQVITPVAAIPAAKVTPTPAPAAAPAPAPINPVPVSSGVATSIAPISQPATADLYAWGNCTWWASARRSETGNPIPNTWGNAATWASRAAQDGYSVDHNPSPGAIMQTSRSAGGLGHVAFVESVDPDGTWHISEMNSVGLNVVDYRARSMADAAVYNFIHGK